MSLKNTSAAAAFSVKLDKDVNDTLNIMIRDRNEMTALSRKLDDSVSHFENDYVKNMAKDETFTKSPMKMTQLLEQVDANSNYAHSALKDVSKNFKRMQDDLTTELTEMAIEHAEYDRLEETFLPELPSNAYAQRVENATAKLGRIFDKGKVQYDIMKALAPLENGVTDVWGVPVAGDTKASETGNTKADAMKSVENSLVAALQQKVQYLQGAVALLTSQKHSKQVQLTAVTDEMRELKEKCRSDIELLQKKLRMDNYKNRHKELTLRDSNMVPDSVSRAELTEALSELAKVREELSAASVELAGNKVIVSTQASEINLLSMDCDRYRKDAPTTSLCSWSCAMPSRSCATLPRTPWPT
jgi:hypothetical protein